jgi:uncharacterized protein (UPF0548 family)
MRAHLTMPSQTQLAAYLKNRNRLPFSYQEVGASAGVFPAHYHQHSNRFYLGEGPACWQRAKAAIDQWQPFNNGWANVFPAAAPIEEKVAVVVSFRIFGVWWKNACRIVYVTHTDKAHGFAYGTLPGHVGRGEEYFGVERDEDGKCWFVLKAYSQPDYWAARLLPGFLRWQQQRFVRAAAKSMRRACQE